MKSYRQTSVVRTLVFTFCWQSTVKVVMMRTEPNIHGQHMETQLQKNKNKKTHNERLKSQMSKNPKGQFLNHDLPPSKAITHNYDSNEKQKKTRKTNEAEMDGRNRDLKNKQNENIFIDIQQTCSIKHICG